MFNSFVISNKFFEENKERLFNVFFEDQGNIYDKLDNFTKEDWKNIKNEIFYEFENDSHFAEVKNHELVQDRLNILRDMQDYAGKYWSHEYIRKHILMMTDDEVKTNDEQIQKEIDDPRFSGEEDMQFNSAEIDTDNKQEINEDIDKKIEEKFQFAKKENDIKDKVNDILFSVLEDDEKFVD